MSIATRILHTRVATAEATTTTTSTAKGQREIMGPNVSQLRQTTKLSSLYWKTVEFQSILLPKSIQNKRKSFTISAFFAQTLFSRLWNG